MRPCFLALEGLACFSDRQEIDLRGLDLFAISGPTGAGKSTILDGLTFALYGEVPRVTTQERSEMISISRDRASVTLDFEVGTELYRIARTLRRNGGHQVRLEKHDGKDFSINLADQVRTVSERVVEILGIDAIAFKQAVVLPQGEFAKFLKAEPRERRAMLRSLLRLDIYERMRELGQRATSAKKTIVDSTRKILAEEYAGVDEQSIAHLQERHSILSDGLKQTRQRREEAQQGLASIRERHNRSVELLQRESERERLSRAAPAIDAIRKQITAAQRAAPLVSLLEEAKRADDAARTAVQRLNASRKEEAEAKEAGKVTSIALEAAEKNASAIPVLRAKISALDQVVGRLPEVQRLSTTIATRTREMEAFVQEIATLDMSVKTALLSQNKQTAAIKQAQEALNASGYDSSLEALLEDVRERSVALGLNRRSASEGKEQLREKEKELNALRMTLVPLETALQASRASVKTVRASVQDAENALHGAHQLEATNYLRSTLRTDAQCPVCEQTVASPPPAGLTPEMDAAKKRVATERRLLREAETKAQTTQDALTRAQTNATAAEKTVAELSDRCKELDSSIATDADQIGASLSQYPIPADALVEIWIAQAVTSMAESRKVHEKNRKALDEADHALDKARSDEAAARERIDEKRSALSQAEDERKSDQDRLATLQGEIAAVSQSGDPAAETTELSRQIETIDVSLRTASTQAAEAKNRMTAAHEALRLTAEAASSAEQEAAARRARRDSEVAQAGFADETALRAALLDDVRSSELAERVRRHDQDAHTAEQRIRVLREELGGIRVSDQDLADAEKATTDLNTRVENQHAEQKTLENQIEQMRGRLERSNKMRTELASVERELRIYSRLSADLRSDKFQAYVLEEAFTELMQGASARLMALTGERYSLLFREGEILVVDNDNAGETRISQTLSGGETFLTSLSLALELSDQVQRAAGAVNLDSLFIDEGFGTLDPDTLALVSETIQNLRVGGRMVGIITHIPELRDEFAQQIVVTKHRGCSRVEVRALAGEPPGAWLNLERGP